MPHRGMPKRPIRREITIWRIEGYRSEAQKAPEDPQLQFNLGAAAYKGKQYPEALLCI